MEDDKRQYLDFIQNIITRMNSNSFLIKGWTITIVSALLVLFATIKTDSLYLITILPIVIFWGLDAKYLQMERKYVNLFQKATAPLPTVSLYDMNIEEVSIKSNPKNKYWKSFKSSTILPFYLLLTLVTSGLCIFFMTKKIEVKKETIKVTIENPLKVKIIDTIKVSQKGSVLKSNNVNAVAPSTLKR